MMKSSLKVLSFVICICLFLPFTAFPASVTAAEDNTLFAARLGYDNGKISGIWEGVDRKPLDIDGDSKITASDAVNMKKIIIGKVQLSRVIKLSSDANADGKTNASDMIVLKKVIVGKAAADSLCLFPSFSTVSYNSSNKCATLSPTGENASVRIELPESTADFTKDICIVLNSQTTNGIDIYPTYDSLETASRSNKSLTVSYNGKAYYKLPSSDKKASGIILTLPQSASLDISEIFVCDGEYSSKWIIDNRINPSSGTKKNLTVTMSNETVALRLGQMTEDDRLNQNGGLYHDYVNSKWPTVTVDENDKLYVTASGCRMVHVDPFGATVLVTSEDGGKSFSKPRQISNTIMDDRDSGVVYLGNGTLLATYFTNSVESYLPGGENYGVLKLRDYGGSSASWQAASWDDYGNPIGGINGTFVKMTDFILKNDPTYQTDYASYVVKSTDYGETWSSIPYSFNKTGTTAAMKKMLSDYQITYPGTRVAVTSEHGPIKLSDGTVLYAGKVLDETDQPRDTMAVYVSHDDGDTWSYRSEIERPEGYGPNNFHELSVTETKDGALLCAIRTQPSETGKMDIYPSGTVYTCFSYDKGRTWTVPAPTGIDGTPPHVITADNGDIIMVSGHRIDPRYIYANVSTDGGRTWSESDFCSGKCVNGDDMGYPASALLSDGTIVTVYYASYHYQNYADQYSSIYAVRWKYNLS